MIKNKIYFLTNGSKCFINIINVSNSYADISDEIIW